MHVLTICSDAYSGGYINLYHITENGWVKHGFSDTNPIFWKEKLEKGGFENVSSTFPDDD